MLCRSSPSVTLIVITQELLSFFSKVLVIVITKDMVSRVVTVSWFPAGIAILEKLRVLCFSEDLNHETHEKRESDAEISSFS
jgi:hypothetical protein